MVVSASATLSSHRRGRRHRRLSTAVADDDYCHRGGATAVDAVDDDSDSCSEDGATATTTTSSLDNAPQQLAYALNNWALSGRNAPTLLSEGGIDELVSLSLERGDDASIQWRCAKAFKSLCCGGDDDDDDGGALPLTTTTTTPSLPELRLALLEKGACASLVRLSCQVKNPQEGYDCARALVSFTSLPRGCGTEERIVQEGVVSAFTALISLAPRTVGPLCVQGIYNLTCVTEYYGSLVVVIKALANLPAKSATIDPKCFVVKGLCNCSAIGRLRMTLLEEGCLGVVDDLIHEGDNVESVTLACVRLLYNISRSRGTRKEMAAKGVVKLLVFLTGDRGSSSCGGDVTLARLIAATIANLSLLRSLRLVKDGIVTGLNNLTNRWKFDGVVATRCAEALAILTSGGSEGIAERVVAMTDGIVYEILVDLLSLADADATDEACHARVILFCNLSKVPEAHNGLIATGAVKALLAAAGVACDGGDDKESQCCNDADIATSQSLALYRLTLSPVTINHAMPYNLLSALVHNATHPSPTIQEIIASSLCHLAMRSHSYRSSPGKDGCGIISLMMKGGVLPAVQHLMSHSTDITVIRHCVTTLAIIATDGGRIKSYGHGEKEDEHDDEDFERSSVLEECINGLISLGQTTNDEKTKLVVVGALSRLTEEITLRKVVFDRGGLKVILRLSGGDNKMSKSCCAGALCHISAETEGALQMLEPETDIVAVLGTLSMTYDEETQKRCAKCFRHLSLVDGGGTALVKQGALQVIMMIAMVRAVDTRTKLYCAEALHNSVSDGTLSDMVDQGVLKAFASFSRQSDEDMMRVCARSFCAFSAAEAGRRALVPTTTKSVVLEGVMSLIRSRNGETIINVFRCCVNLLSFGDSRTAAARYGGLQVVRLLSSATEDVVASSDYLRAEKYKCEELVAKCLCDIIDEPICHSAILKEDIPSLVVMLLQSDDAATSRMAVRTLCSLSYIKNFRSSLIQCGGVSVLVWRLLNGGPIQDIAQDAAKTFCYLSIAAEGRDKMIDDHVVPALTVLSKRVIGTPEKKNITALCALTLQHLSHCTHATYLTKLIHDGAVPLLVDILTNTTSQDNVDMEIARNTSVAFASISCTLSPIALRSLLTENAVTALSLSVSRNQIQNDEDAIVSTIGTLNNLSSVPHGRFDMCQKGACRTLVALAPLANARGRQLCASALCRLSHSRRSRPIAVKEGTVECLIDLATTNTTSAGDAAEIRQTGLVARQCGLALGHLSAHTRVEKAGTVKAILNIIKTAPSPEVDDETTTGSQSWLSSHSVISSNASTASGTSSELRQRSGMKKGFKLLKNMVSDGRLFFVQDANTDMDETPQALSPLYTDPSFQRRFSDAKQTLSPRDDLFLSIFKDTLNEDPIGDFILSSYFDKMAQVRNGGGADLARDFIDGGLLFDKVEEICDDEDEEEEEVEDTESEDDGDDDDD